MLLRNVCILYDSCVICFLRNVCILYGSCSTCCCEMYVYCTIAALYAFCEMYVYCTVAAVYAVAKSKHIRLFIAIPLVVANHYFVLYQVHSLLLLHNGVGNLFMTDEVLLTWELLRKDNSLVWWHHLCLSKFTQNLYTISPSEIVLITAGCRTVCLRYFGKNWYCF